MKLSIMVAAALVLLPQTASIAGSEDLAKGKAQFLRCQSCHALQSGDPKRIGPSLHGIVGKPAGKQEGFRYSKTLAEADFIWTAEKLDEFLAGPRALVPGTSMVFSGLKDPAARKALIAYIESVK